MQVFRATTSPRLTRLLTVLAAVGGVVLAGSELSFANPRAVEGEYIIVPPSRSGRIGALSTSAPARFSGGVVSVRQDVGRDTKVVSVRSTRMGVSTLSSSSRRFVEVDSKDTTCRDLIRAGIAQECSPNFEVTASSVVPSDPRFNDLWGLSSALGIDAPRAWELSTGDSNAVVAVLDTGVDYTHEDLAANMWTNPQEVASNGIDDDGNGYVDDVYGINAITGAAAPGNPMDDHFHGTHVAGTIGARGDNGIGVVGVNQQVKIMALKFLSSSGSGALGDAIRALNYLIDMKLRGDVNVRVVNNSWGGSGYSAPMRIAIERARDAGIIFVAAAGNANSDNDVLPTYPAGYDVNNVVSVLALTSAQERAGYSNFGAYTVHIAAPGSSVLSTVPGNGYATYSGTSMATPHVSGALALLMAYQPTLTNAQAILRMYESGRELAGLVNGSGRRVVRTIRTLDVGRMLYGNTATLPPLADSPDGCGYATHTTNLLSGGGVDTSADAAPVVNNLDEGGYYRLDLPFEFPFFSERLSTVYVSPNGVIYKRMPSIYDWDRQEHAPLDSIAVLHADLIPRAAGQGVRVAVTSDKATIAWSSELYMYPGQGVVTTRATLYPTGQIETSVSFAEPGGTGTLRRYVFGDGASLGAEAALGVAGGNYANLFTVNAQVAVAGLGVGVSDPVVLGVNHSLQCGAGGVAPTPEPPETPVAEPGAPEEPEVARVSSIRVRAIRRGRRETLYRGNVSGSGSGVIEVTASIDRKRCEGASSVRVASGTAMFEVSLPNDASRFALSANGVTVRHIQPRALSSSSRLSARVHARACRNLLSGIR